MPATIEIDIAHEAGDWPDLEKLINASLNAAITDLNLHGDGEVSIVLADDAFIRKLNHDYRDKDKPTNVLSFPQLEEIINNMVVGPLGDIVLALETIRREADEAGKTFSDHVSHLLIHGFLHLLGYDHENDEEAEEMESTEIRILKTLGIKNPYEVPGFVQ